MAKTLQEEFIDLVNAKNPGLGLTVADVDFGNPGKYVSSVEGDIRNSVLTLVAKSDSPTFQGEKAYHFRRFDFTHPNGEDTYSVATTDVLENWTDNAYALSVFNMMLPDHKLALEDITITFGGTGSDGSGSYTDVKLTINPNHLKWTGAFVWRVYDGKDNLQWKSGELDGFN